MEKYDVISVVGEGSYGLVMRCRHRESGQYVAIKKFLETEDDLTVRKMALREIRMLKKLRHENLVNMIEVFRRKKRFFLVFEYLEHTVLEELEARSGGLGFVTSRKYIYQILRALDFIHSNNVIHRDIKPENVLVSRLGVIKLCDFGFARPYAENETFTDYVATRWYRSPELLVGDPRYGKEVDIWATGCLYAEMMTGEPLFPGESDVDQLFQIVRILGKVNSRHQILITRNTIFKGMKQEQNSSLLQLFPDWNRDSLDFLSQCLKMDGSARPETGILLKHDLFTRDDFLDNFLAELRTKIHQEMQGNPLLKRLSNGFGSGRKTAVEERKLSNGGGVNDKNLLVGKDQKSFLHPKERISQIGLSLLSTTQLNNSNVTKTLESNIFRPRLGSDEISLNLTSYKHYLNTNHNINSINKTLLGNPTKPISINNLTFTKDNENSGKFGTRVVSAKLQKNNPSDKTTNQQNPTNLDLNIQPPSPVQFQSLQPESLSQGSIEKTSQRCSPLSVTNLTITGSVPQYFTNKRTTNILGNLQHHHQKTTTTTTNPTTSTTSKHSPSLHLQLGVARTNLAKRERGLLLDVGLTPLNMLGNTPESIKVEASPRVLPPPPWLTGNLKVTSQGKTTLIGKRGVTDWKSVSHQNNSKLLGASDSNNDFILPNCPGASTSPYKGLKKKLTPMATLPGPADPHNTHLFTTPRNFSASSELGNET